MPPRSWDSTEHWPYIEDVTADFVYLRLYSTENKYAGAAYSDPALQRWTRRIACWAQGGLPDDAMLPVSDNTHHAPPRIVLF
ncbi:DUF72 domain-containing protein [Mycetohabitans sp. B8]|uniref:DUF72 domain-containing protein n=1 Tax=Mycetohabitans sp. B8 TaxID=2841845 RepID=UPI001F1771EC|nr:DUF72 domain-containing protein [Mycetohabitans sp. B8]